MKGQPFKVGKNYFIRTVTMIVTGKLKAVYDNELVLTEASWIADTGRYTQAVASGDFDEVEPYPDKAELIVGRGSIIDALAVSWKLPREQK